MYWARGVLVYARLFGETVPVLKGPRSVTTEVYPESSRGSLFKG